MVNGWLACEFIVYHNFYNGSTRTISGQKLAFTQIHTTYIYVYVCMYVCMHMYQRRFYHIFLNFIFSLIFTSLQLFSNRGGQSCIYSCIYIYIYIYTIYLNKSGNCAQAALAYLTARRWRNYVVLSYRKIACEYICISMIKCSPEAICLANLYKNKFRLRKNMVKIITKNV